MMLDSIRISGHEYCVERKDNLKDDDGVSCYGIINSKDLKIELMSGMPETLERETIIHEIMHGFCNHGGVFPNEDGMVSIENVFDIVSNGFMQMGYDPPWLDRK